MKDVFICHASEDKKNVVTPLENAFLKNDITYWIDSNEILWGDSLIQKVNEGLSISQYVIVVLSKNFISKNWPRRELNSVLNIESSTGEVKVLPLIVGNGNSTQEILKEFPLLNDKLYLTWIGDPNPIVEALKVRLERAKAPNNAKTGIKKQEQESAQEIYIPQIKKQYTQRDKDQFLSLAFENIKSYFKRGLIQLQKTYDEIETDLIPINNTKFISKLYINGDLKCQCKIWIDNTSSYNSIGYFEGSMLQDDNSMNEQITVIDDNTELKLKFLIGFHMGQYSDKAFLPNNAAEELWKRFIFPIERYRFIQ